MNYIGSKYSLLDFLKTSISDVTGYRPGEQLVFGDLFAGTSVVGAAYREMGCHVIANDIQYYGYVLAKHRIENSQPLDREFLERLNSIDGEEGFVYQHFCRGGGSGRNYFTDENGRKCDAIRLELEKGLKRGLIDESTYFWGLASLINSMDQVANTASVYGAFLKKIKKTAGKPLVLELLPVVSGEKGTVFHQDINRLIRDVEGDILYLDPPYNARQYCSNYHVLETIAKYDHPKLRGKTGLRDKNENKSRYCSKRSVEQVFEDLIANARFEYIFLSYNNEGLMGLDAIREILSKYGEYDCFTREYKRFQADTEENRRIAADGTIEYLHFIKKF